MHMSPWLVPAILALASGTITQARAADYTYANIPPVPHAPGTNVIANGINNNGEVVGSAGALSYYEGFTYQNGQAKVFAAFGATGKPGQTASTYGQGVTRNHVVTGYISNGMKSYVGTPHTLGQVTFPGADRVFAYGVNRSHQLVGYYTDSTGAHGFTGQPNYLHSVDIPQATPGTTYAYGINNLGAIVGSYADATGTHGFKISSSAHITTIDVPGAKNTMAYGINNKGEIVGAFNTDGATPQAFEETSGVFTTLAIPGSSTGFSTANGINDGGTIVGSYATTRTPNPNIYGFIATPTAPGHTTSP